MQHSTTPPHPVQTQLRMSPIWELPAPAMRRRGQLQGHQLTSGGTPEAGLQRKGNRKPGQPDDSTHSGPTRGRARDRTSAAGTQASACQQQREGITAPQPEAQSHTHTSKAQREDAAVKRVKLSQGMQWHPSWPHARNKPPHLVQKTRLQAKPPAGVAHSRPETPGFHRGERLACHAVGAIQRRAHAPVLFPPTRGDTEAATYMSNVRAHHPLRRGPHPPF